MRINTTSLVARYRIGILAACSLLLLCIAPLAFAGNIFFDLAIDGDRLSLTNRGDSSAYYPVVLRLTADGRWQALPLLPGMSAPAQVLRGEKIRFVWDVATPVENLSPLERLQPVMVRFFDQAGAGFGQISLFKPAPPAPAPLKVDYADGWLTVAPPANGSIHASWLLWPQEEGIVPLRHPVGNVSTQPPARRIEWRAGMDAARFYLGAARPSAILLHETDAGLVAQNVNDGGSHSREQRVAWLDASIFFYCAALALALLALGAVLARPFAAWRRAGVK
ncbi:MAG: hypothetical protein P4L91_09990 [Burkholderiaceae bacterium]|nr:hypothetical protein [Burkholderiaceae bacterium]